MELMFPKADSSAVKNPLGMSPCWGTGVGVAPSQHSWACLQTWGPGLQGGQGGWDSCLPTLDPRLGQFPRQPDPTQKRLRVQTREFCMVLFVNSQEGK